MPAAPENDVRAPQPPIAEPAASAGSAETLRKTRNLGQIMRLEVPIVVRLAERPMKVDDVLGWSPGSIIELPKPADAELDLLVNNKAIGTGVAVKVGENFGLKVTRVGDVPERIGAMGGAA